MQLLVSTVTANAPFDFNRECVNPSNFRIVPPIVENNVCVLMDSRYYSSLIGNGGVWRAIETDPNGITVSFSYIIIVHCNTCSYRVQSK